MGKLNVMAVRAAKEAGRYVDGQGLMLVVKPSGARSWQLRIQFDGKRRDIGLGSAIDVSLAEAREKASEARKLVRQGIDPVEAKKASKRLAAQIMTFEQAALALHDERKEYWRNDKHREQWISTLRSYAFPGFGSETVDKVSSAQVREALLPIWQSKPETARRVLQRVGTVLDWAHAKGERQFEAPLRSIRAGLPRQLKTAEHFASMPHVSVAGLMTVLKQSDTPGRLALRFLILTAARSGEVRGATWSEIDTAKALWTIPASRMKAKKEHVVPLAPAALEILELALSLRKTASPDECVFPGLRGQPLSDMTLTKVLRMTAKTKWTVHGFRSSFRDWAAESTTFPSEVAETALAHTIPNKVEAAYRRTNFLEKRKEMMAQWADYIIGEKE